MKSKDKAKDAGTAPKRTEAKGWRILEELELPLDFGELEAYTKRVTDELGEPKAPELPEMPKAPDVPF